MASLDSPIAVCYLARGADTGAHESFARFISSYRRFEPGAEHRLYVIFKGFAGERELADARRLFEGLDHAPFFLGDESFDIGAYIEWANQVSEAAICPVNTASEILSHDWLGKLAANFTLRDVGLVGATASYESQMETDVAHYPAFPNIHIRSNAFMIDRQVFCDFTRGLVVRDKVDAHRFESSRNSFTRHVLSRGERVLLVGRNGRGYSPEFWPRSDTFRQGRQDNLLVADNQTRVFASLPWAEKRDVVLRTWGDRYALEPLSRAAGHSTRSGVRRFSAR
jgi:hypothetical protein